MREQRLNVDLSVLRCGQVKLAEETAVLRSQALKLLEAVRELDSCWEPSAGINFEDVFLTCSVKLNSLADGMGMLAECMDFAVKMYLCCENAAEDSVRAVNVYS